MYYVHTYFLNIFKVLVQYFYNVKNGSSIITSKSLSKNLNNENNGVMLSSRQNMI